MIHTTSWGIYLTHALRTLKIGKNRITGTSHLRFSKLRLTGFKSFVDPTELLISDGLTGVVGPNGCGKSNLLEALRWVMGENRPTAMRGGGMEDVIFAGAATRPARNFAEVSLMLDNSERLAPQGFNDADSLEIIRRITRDAGSAYKASGKDVRARDVQMLFADASTGAHSPSLVRQGQISELINAKPKNRRRVLEEAAGISGLYQRRHEAELKLNNTETNLARVEDVLEQLASQLAQLAKQAKQAARYRAIGEELRTAESTLLYLLWHEARQKAVEMNGVLREKTLEVARAETAARETEKLRQIAEDALPPVREEEAVALAILQRLHVEREGKEQELVRAQTQIETLQNRLSQIERDLEREAGLNADAGQTLASLKSEQEDLTKAQEGHEVGLEAAKEVALAAAETLHGKEADLSAVTEDVARLAARHQSAERYLADCKSTLHKHEEGAKSAQEALETAREKQNEADQSVQAAKESTETAGHRAVMCEKELSELETKRAHVQTIDADARMKRSEAEGEERALSAEVLGLQKLIERDSSETVQLIDTVRAEKGYERALGSVLIDDLRAAEVGELEARSGWVALEPYPEQTSFPESVIGLSAFVHAPAVLKRRLSLTGLVSQSEGNRLQGELRPGQRLVSREGDVWRWDGFRVRSDDISSTAALRLENMNRLSDLKIALEAAKNVTQQAVSQQEHSSAELRDISEQEKRARDARREADAALTQSNRALNTAEAELNVYATRLESYEIALQGHKDEAVIALKQLKEAEHARDELDNLEEARETVAALKESVEAARITMMTKRSQFDEIRREGEDREKRLIVLAKSLADWEKRLGTAKQRSQELFERQSETERNLQEARRVPSEIEGAQEKLASAIETAEARCKEASDTLAKAETVLREAIHKEKEAERLSADMRATLAAQQARVDAAQDAEAQAESRIQDERQKSPEALLLELALDTERLKSVDTVENDVNRLKRQRDALGAVNLRAEEDAREVETEYETLKSEKTDLEDAVRALRNGIANLNKEGRERLLTAFEQVNTNFGTLFKHLFGGGEANLVMVESDDPLEAGLEIMCQPPGKKLSTMSLLSGGEQTLTALALIFAVFLANPAPICVLDEVDAPLDDANVTRFCDMLDEMCRRTNTRFLIITHHAVTMARMDRLFGVTMQEQGVSQLVSVDLKKAEALVA